MAHTAQHSQQNPLKTKAGGFLRSPFTIDESCLPKLLQQSTTTASSSSSSVGSRLTTQTGPQQAVKPPRSSTVSDREGLSRTGQDGSRAWTRAGVGAAQLSVKDKQAQANAASTIYGPSAAAQDSKAAWDAAPPPATSLTHSSSSASSPEPSAVAEQSLQTDAERRMKQLVAVGGGASRTAGKKRDRDGVEWSAAVSHVQSSSETSGSVSNHGNSSHQPQKSGAANLPVSSSSPTTHARSPQQQSQPSKTHSSQPNTVRQQTQQQPPLSRKQQMDLERREALFGNKKKK